MHESPELLLAASRYKATARLSLRDAWIAACAELADATLMHKAPQFDALDIPQQSLPYKAV